MHEIQSAPVGSQAPQKGSSYLAALLLVLGFFLFVIGGLLGLWVFGLATMVAWHPGSQTGISPLVRAMLDIHSGLCWLTLLASSGVTWGSLLIYHGFDRLATCPKVM